MKINNRVIVLGVLGLAAATAASATDTTWDFYALSQPGGQRALGSSYNFMDGGQDILASVWSPAPTSSLLYAKNAGTGETGLGLTPNAQNEISYPLGIELKLTGGSFSAPQIGSVQGSSTSGESYQVQASNDGVHWTTISQGVGGGTGTGHNIINVTGLSGYTWVILDTPFANNSGNPPYGSTNGSNNIVLDSVVTVGVPEPLTLGLMGFGFAALAFARRRKG